MAHKGHYALSHNIFRIIKYAFQIMHNTLQIPETHSKFFETHFKFTTNPEIFTPHFKIFITLFKIFTTHFKIFAPHFEIFTTHFEIFTTHSPQDPKCWQRKRNGYAAPPSCFDAMFCSTCGESLQVSVKFCPKCGKDLANNKEMKVGNETSGKKNLSFKEFKETEAN